MKTERASLEQERRERIAKAAFELFARSGIEGTSASEIARAAFVSRTNLYRYFPSKAHMLLAHFEQTLAETQAEVTYRLSSGANPQAVWKHVTTRFADLGVRYEHLVGIVGQAVLTSRNAASLRSNEDGLRTALMLTALVETTLRAMQTQGHVRAGADTHLLATLLVDVCLLALLHGNHRTQHEVLSDWQERFSVLMQGIGADTRQP